MSKHTLLAVALVAGVAVAAAVGLSARGTKGAADEAGKPQERVEAPAAPAREEPTEAPAKEFTMTSFVEFADGKPKPQFSLKEITVKKGDLVRLKITNIKGKHDFNLDEFGVHAATPPDTEVAVEFTADKAGEFIYYCSMPGHRANGHWGTLKVLE